mmetsp:Transcript_24134/g.52870  ORF Transcript_24134/g.52870 Transcript_24134/m.52870 type:complete len:177 (+) Transcript_24134:709-1239(+)
MSSANGSHGAPSNREGTHHHHRKQQRCQSYQHRIKSIVCCFGTYRDRKMSGWPRERSIAMVPSSSLTSTATTSSNTIGNTSDNNNTQPITKLASGTPTTTKMAPSTTISASDTTTTSSNYSCKTCTYSDNNPFVESDWHSTGVFWISCDNSNRHWQVREIGIVRVSRGRRSRSDPS